jgi:hypothetical protein
MGDPILNVILHGLLFLELKNGSSSPQLQITAPDLSSNHDLLIGVPGNLQNINFKEIHWEDPTLKLKGGLPGLPAVNGVPTDVPDSIFQFSRTSTQVGDIDKSHIQGKIILPWPAKWATIRKDNRPPLTTRLQNKPVDQQVHTDIERRCGNIIGVVTVLTYTYPLSFPPIPGWTPSTNIEIYFQPKGRETVQEVNADLRAASFQLFSSDNFDLAIDISTGNTSTPIGQMPFPPNSGLSIEDELSLNENVMVIDPRNLDPQVKQALLTLEEYLDQLEAAVTTTPLQRTQSSDLSKLKNAAQLRRMPLFIASPANCPTMFLGNP